MRSLLRGIPVSAHKDLRPLNSELWGDIHIYATARDQEEGPVRVGYKYTGGDRGPSRTRTLAIKRRVPRKKIKRNKVYRRTGSSAGRTGLLCCCPPSAHSPRSISSSFVTKDCYCPEFYSEYEPRQLFENHRGYIEFMIDKRSLRNIIY